MALIMAGSCIGLASVARSTIFGLILQSNGGSAQPAKANNRTPITNFFLLRPQILVCVNLTLHLRTSSSKGQQKMAMRNQGSHSVPLTQHY